MVGGLVSPQRFLGQGVGSLGWVAGTARYGSVLLSRGWLITVKAPEHPRHPPSTQLDTVVKCG